MAAAGTIHINDRPSIIYIKSSSWNEAVDTLISSKRLPQHTPWTTPALKTIREIGTPYPTANAYALTSKKTREASCLVFLPQTWRENKNLTIYAVGGEMNVREMAIKFILLHEVYHCGQAQDHLNEDKADAYALATLLNIENCSVKSINFVKKLYFKKGRSLPAICSETKTRLFMDPEIFNAIQFALHD